MPTRARRRRGKVIALSDDLIASDHLEIHEVASTEPTPEEAVIQKADRQLLLTALTLLPASLREVLVLREMEGLSYAEIAAITNSPIGTVMSRLSRGRAELRKAVLEQRTGEPQP